MDKRVGERGIVTVWKMVKYIHIYIYILNKKKGECSVVEVKGGKKLWIKKINNENKIKI